MCLPRLPRPALPAYDLLLQGGHVLDDKNHIDAVMDVAIKDGKIAKVAEHISPTDALKTIDAKGLYVTPGLIDIHVHVYTGTGERNSYAGDNSVPPDGFTFRVGVTTVVDAGCSGWNNFEDFKDNASSIARRPAFLQCSTLSAPACAATSTRKHGRHGWRSHGEDGPQVSQRRRRHQDRTLRRT